MCQLLQTSLFHGYKQSIVQLDNVTYSLKSPCDSNSSIKFLLDPKPPTSTKMILGGLEFHLSHYLAKALNVSMKFLKMKRYPEEQSNGMYNELNGDVIADSHHAWSAISPMTQTVRPLQSPIYSFGGFGLISVNKMAALTMSDVIHIFRLNVS